VSASSQLIIRQNIRNARASLIEAANDIENAVESEKLSGKLAVAYLNLYTQVDQIGDFLSRLEQSDITFPEELTQ